MKQFIFMKIITLIFFSAGMFFLLLVDWRIAVGVFLFATGMNLENGSRGDTR